MQKGKGAQGTNCAFDITPSTNIGNGFPNVKLYMYSRWVCVRVISIIALDFELDFFLYMCYAQILSLP
jgi:hypothetical protein